MKNSIKVCALLTLHVALNSIAADLTPVSIADVALLYAAKAGDAGLVKDLIENRGGHVEVRDPKDMPPGYPAHQTPLMCACEHGHLDAVKVLVEHGACVDAADDVHGMRALSWACIFNKDAAIVQYLIDHGAAPDGEDRCSGQTPLMHAITHTVIHEDGRASAIVRLLLTHDIAINKQDCMGRTALMYAVSGVWRDWRIAIVKLLLAHGADVNIPCESGETPLMRAVSDLEIVNLLLDHGARVNDRTKSGVTPFMCAARGGTIPVIERLMHAGADIYAKCSPGWYGGSALAAARREDGYNGHEGIADYLSDVYDRISVFCALMAYHDVVPADVTADYPYQEFPGDVLDGILGPQVFYGVTGGY